MVNFGGEARRGGWLALAAILALAVPALGAGEGGGVLFPQPFVVEHHAVQRDGDGAAFTGEQVSDFYGGGWIVSVRADGSRTVIDLARRQLTEITPASATYSVLGLDRLAELRRALQPRRGDESPAAGLTARALAGDVPSRSAPVELMVEELADDAGEAPARWHAKAARAQGPQPLRHLRVSARPAAAAALPGEASPLPALEVWLDPSLQLSAAAQAALARFEDDLLGDPEATAALPRARCLGAARATAGGAFPVRARRPLGRGGEGALGDIATRGERL
ncbi:MAG: hypothetical protein V1750_00020, partial [Acidobacteriota bacterium]